MKLKQCLIEKGSDRSGNYGHVGNPPNRGGSGKGGGFSMIGTSRDSDTSSIKLAAREWKEKIIRVKKDIRDRTIELGYDPKKVRYAGVGYAFTVGNDNYTAGGDFNPNTGEIRIFKGLIVGDRVHEGSLAHEVQHAIFNNYVRKRKIESNEMDKRFKEEDNNGIKYNSSFMKPDGSLRNPDDEKLYPAYIISRILLSDYYGSDINGKKLRKGQSLSELDGVTSYSTSYWKKAKESGSYSDYILAVNETLAEIKRLKVEKSKTKISKKWIDLYNSINSIPLEK